MTDNKRVFKCIEDWAKLIPSGQSMLLEDYASQQHDLPGLYTMDKVVYDDKALLFSYPYEASDVIKEGIVIMHLLQVLLLLWKLR